MNNIKAIRKQRGLSVTELAQKLGMSQSNLTKIENNQLELKPSIAQKIAEILDVAPTSINEIPQDSKGYTHIDIINPEEVGLPTLSTYPILVTKNTSMSTSLVVYIMPDDTMTPTILNHTAVIIDTNIKTFTKNGIYLIKNSGLTELRRIQQIDNTTVIIQTDNKAYTSKNDDKSNLNIIGKAIGTHTYFSL